MPYDVKENGRNGNYNISSQVNTDDINPNDGIDEKDSNRCSCHDNDYPVKLIFSFNNFLCLAIYGRNSRSFSSFIVKIAKIKDFLVDGSICLYFMRNGDNSSGHYRIHSR